MSPVRRNGCSIRNVIRKMNNAGLEVLRKQISTARRYIINMWLIFVNKGEFNGYSAKTED